MVGYEYTPFVLVLFYATPSTQLYKPEQNWTGSEQNRTDVNRTKLTRTVYTRTHTRMCKLTIHQCVVLVASTVVVAAQCQFRQQPTNDGFTVFYKHLCRSVEHPNLSLLSLSRSFALFQNTYVRSFCTSVLRHLNFKFYALTSFSFVFFLFLIQLFGCYIFFTNCQTKTCSLSIWVEYPSLFIPVWIVWKYSVRPVCFVCKCMNEWMNESVFVWVNGARCLMQMYHVKSWLLLLKKCLIFSLLLQHHQHSSHINKNRRKFRKYNWRFVCVCGSRVCRQQFLLTFTQKNRKLAQPDYANEEEEEEEEKLSRRNQMSFSLISYNIVL